MFFSYSCSLSKESTYIIYLRTKYVNNFKAFLEKKTSSNVSSVVSVNFGTSVSEVQLMLGILIKKNQRFAFINNKYKQFMLRNFLNLFYQKNLLRSWNSLQRSGCRFVANVDILYLYGILVVLGLVLVAKVKEHLEIVLNAKRKLFLNWKKNKTSVQITKVK